MRRKVTGSIKRILSIMLLVGLTVGSMPETVYAEPEMTAFVKNEEVENTGNEDVEELIVTTEVMKEEGGENVIDLSDPTQIPNYGYISIEKPGEVESIYAVPVDEMDSMEIEEELPEKYVNENLPDTRYQGVYGTCWAHSSIAVAEANMVKTGMMDKNETDTSELHLAYFAYHTVEDPLGGITQDSRSIGGNGENYLDAGGNVEQATRTLFAWLGVAAEETAPYSECINAYDNGLDHNIAFQDIAHIKNAYVIHPTTEREEAKRLIYQYGALTTSYFASQSGNVYAIGGKKYYFTDFYNYDNNAYYCPVKTSTNHAVTIVGWDDNFPKENFSIQPEGDGAWLIRNSWTTSNSQNYNGYFWMSYYDQSLSYDSYAYEIESADKYDNNYQYDGTYFSINSYADTCANVFEVKASEQGECLEAIAFETDNTNLDYVIEIYTQLAEAGDPSTGKLSAICTGETKYAGYHTVELPYPVTLDYGERFAVVVKLTKDEYGVGVKQEYSYDDLNFSSVAHTGAGESYYYNESSWYDDGGWYDVYSGNSRMGNFCIKAYTRNFTDRVQETDIVFSNIVTEGITLGVEEEYQILARVVPVNAEEKTIIYKSSDEDVVAVTEDGKLTGMDKGNAVITVMTVNGITKEFAVTVVEKVNSLEITGEDYVYVGSEPVYTVSWKPEFVTPNGTVKWSSSNPEVMKIDENTGNAQALSVGKTDIHAELDGVNVSYEVQVRADSSMADLHISVTQDSVVTFTWKPVRGATKYVIDKNWETLETFEEDGRESYSYIDTSYQGCTEIQTISYGFDVYDEMGVFARSYDVNVGPCKQITYVIPHGTNSEKNPDYYRPGEYIYLEDPVIEPGYLFGGWYTDSEYTESVWSINNEHTENLTLYANVTPIVYYIEYHSNWEWDSTDFVLAEYGQEITLPADKFQREGYEFTGWNTKADGTGISYDAGQVISNLTTEYYGYVPLYAQWKPKEYEVSFDANEGEVLSDKKTVAYSQPYGTLPTANRDGYEFLGWYTAKEGGSLIQETDLYYNTENTVLYAQWQRGAYIVTFEPGEGTLMGGTTKTVYAEQFYGELPQASRNGYRFTGWFLNYNGEEQRITEESVVTVLRDHELVARWEEIIKIPCNPPAISIEGEIVEGSIGESEYVVVNQGAKVALSGDMLDTIYYAFLNEEGQPIGEYQEYTETIPVTGNMRIGVYTTRPGQEEEYAPSEVCIYQFKLYVTPAKITYIISKGMNHVENVTEYLPGETISLKDALADTGYMFEGWYRDEQYQNRTGGVLESDTQDLIFYAKIVPITYQIIYCSNDEKIENVTVNAKYDQNVVIEKELFQREGYWFAGWNTKADGTGTVYEVRENVKNLTSTQGDIIYLYAQWTEIPEEMEGFRVEGLETEYGYTGSAIKPEFKVFDGIKELTEKKDYKVIYKNNKKAGQATVIIRGCGNYKGELITGFEILPINITGEEFSVDNVVVTYNKKVQKPVPKVYRLAKAISAKKDYLVEYYQAVLTNGTYEKTGEALSSVKEPGHYKICLTGIGNYRGQREVDLYVNDTKTTAVSKLKLSKISTQNYNGNKICPKPEIKYKNDVLVEDVHYTLTYYNNMEIGTASVVIQGIEENGYSGTKRLNFAIKGYSLKKNLIKNLNASYEYTGRKIEPFGSVYDVLDTGWVYLEDVQVKGEDAVRLVKGVDYEVVKYGSNRNAGTATAVLKGINKYSGTVSVKFKIQPAKAENKIIAMEYDTSIGYAKGGAKPKVSSVTVELVDTYGNPYVEVLTEGKDYVVSYANNKVVTTSETRKRPMITVKGKGNYSGVLATGEFEIVPQDISQMDIVAKDKVYKEKANNYKTVLTITDTATGKKLGGKDYNTKLKYYYDHDTIVKVKQKKEIISVERAKDTEVQKEDIIPAGTTLRIETDAMNSYYGKVVARYNITSSDFTKAKVTIRNKEYTGHPVTITQEDVLSIKVGGVELDKSEYRIVDCINNTNKGKATVILEGLGNYGGRKSVTFKIEQKNMYFNLFRM